MHQVACEGFKFQWKAVVSCRRCCTHKHTPQLQTQYAKCFQLSGSSCSGASRRMSDVSQPILILMRWHTACNSLYAMLGNGHIRGIMMPWKFQGLLAVSPVMRVQFQSVGAFFIVKLCFLEIKTVWQFKPQISTEREENLPGAFWGKIESHYFLGTNVTGQSWVQKQKQKTTHMHKPEKQRYILTKLR